MTIISVGPFRSKIEELIRMIRQQKEKLQERDKWMSDLVEKVELDPKKISLVVWKCYVAK